MSGAVPRKAARAQSVLSSFVLLMATDLSLRFAGFARSVAMARKLAHPRRAGATPDLTNEVCRRLSLAAVFYPGRARCLEQSLALYVLLRRRGSLLLNMLWRLHRRCTDGSGLLHRRKIRLRGSLRLRGRGVLDGRLADRCVRAYSYLGEMLAFHPQCALVVLNRADWSERASNPL